MLRVMTDRWSKRACTLMPEESDLMPWTCHGTSQINVRFYIMSSFDIFCVCVSFVD